MEKPSYQQAYDKIIQAYFKDEIKPNNARFCFCGTLCNNTSNWHLSSSTNEHSDFGNYTGKEYARMEKALFNNNTNGHGDFIAVRFDYENRLFAGMCAALEVLKQIHIEKGEIIDEEIPEFQKRKLQLQ